MFKAAVAAIVSRLPGETHVEMNAIPVSLGARLRKLRERAGLSQRELATQLGVSHVTAWKWERGDSLPRQQSLAALSEALGVAPEYLLAGITSANDLELGGFGDVRGAAEVDVPLPRMRSQPRPTAASTSGNLRAVIEAAKRSIAEAAGTDAQKVTISLTY